VAPEQIIFCSGGSEANALGILGSVRTNRKAGGHVLVSAIEHPSVRETTKQLAGEGFSVEEIPVTAGGVVEPDAVVARLRSDTRLCAVMHVNNETGVRQPVEEIVRRVKAQRPDCRVLVDAVQSFGVLPVELPALGADLLTLSAHKIEGPKGVGCLAVARDLRLLRLWGGGDQEAGRRAGTENVPGIAGLGRAVELCPADGAPELHRRGELLALELLRQAPQARVLGDPARRLPHILCLAVPGVRSEVLANSLEERGLTVSTGAACHSRRPQRSHVLAAMGVAPELGVVRLSLSRRTAEHEVLEAAAIVGAALKELCP
jgi:cysteine desulfurase